MNKNKFIFISLIIIAAVILLAVVKENGLVSFSGFKLDFSKSKASEQDYRDCVNACTASYNFCRVYNTEGGTSCRSSTVGCYSACAQQYGYPVKGEEEIESELE